MRRLDASTLCRCLALTVGAALATPGALAADAAAPKAPAAAPAKAGSAAKSREGGFGKGTGALLTREQLRQCLAEQERMKQDSADALQAQRALEKDRAEIDRLGAELEADKATLDRTSEAAVEAYNARARARGKMMDDYRAAAPQFNARVDKLDAARQSYAKDCGDRKYFEDDFDAIKAGK